MIDYHLHLVPHDRRRRFTVDDVREYAFRAGEQGLREIAITEHLFRFHEGQRAIGSWWQEEADPALRDQTAAYLEEQLLPQDLGEYAETVLTAADDPGIEGVEVRLGLEVDFSPGSMNDVVALLAEYPFDILLGSVHWLGGWGFDQFDDPVVAEQWRRREPDDVWLAYVEAVEAMAASGACDVLAHVDLAKVTGVRPERTAAECSERLVKAATAHGLCVEISSAGWRKPVGEAYPSGELLRAFAEAGVPATLASDAHDGSLVADRNDDVASLARAAGYREIAMLSKRSVTTVPLPDPGDV